MITPPLHPLPLLYEGLAPPASFDLTVGATEGFPPPLVIAARLKVLKQSGAEVTWSLAIIPDDDETLRVRRAVETGDFDEAGQWSIYLEVQFGTAPGEWMRLAARLITVLDPFQTGVPNQ